MSSPRNQDNLKLTQRVNDAKTKKVLLQCQKARSNVKIEGRNKRLQAEKRVVNSLTQIIDSKSQNDFRNTIVFKVLVKKIKDHLIETGRCNGENACEEAAKKMAAFVSDIMREAYKSPSMLKKKSARSLSKASDGDASRSGSRSSLISRNNVKQNEARPSKKQEVETRPDVKYDVNSRSRYMSRPSTSLQKKDSKQYIAIESKAEDRGKLHLKGDKGDIVDKQKISSWLADVDDRTKKWTSWINETVAKVENSRSRIRSGENVREVSKDWKRFIRDKEDESVQFSRPSSRIRTNERLNEAFRRRGEESIQQWLIKNKLKESVKDNSECSFRSASSESLFNVWNSRQASFIGDDECLTARLRHMGVSPVRGRIQ